MNDLDRLSPLRPDMVYASCHLVRHDRARGEITAELRLVRREWLDGAFAACAQAGAFPTRLCYEDSRIAHHGCLPPLHRPPLALRLTRTAFVALLCTLPLELAAAAFLKAERQQSELEMVLAESAKARAEAKSVERTRGATATLRASFEGMIREAGSNRPSQLIAALSKAVPTDSWSFTLRIDGHQIRLSGFSQSATALLSAIEASPAFRNAQFRAPVVRTQGGQERFEMTFETEAAP
jgi:general secretion pathway protein L